MTILDKIKENALSTPNRIAIVESRGTERDVLSWTELDEYSDRLAFYLNDNLKTKTPIVVYGHKNPYMIVCFLACVKAGRAYCPIDVNVPLSRVEAILNEVNPEIILSTEVLNTDSKALKTLEEIKEIITGEQRTISRNSYVKADDIFYIIFTSGSTGVPKGVQITRDCLDNFIAWAITLGESYKEEEHYTFINQAPFSFDLSVMDLFLSLYTGGTLWCLTKELQMDSKALYQSLGESDADVWVSTPSFADVCLTDPMFSQKLLTKMKTFLFCGEVLTNKTVERLHGRFPNAVIVNTYGPTESTCAITSVTITEELNREISPLPVGDPKKGTWLQIVDENGQIVPEGEHGEIVIVGDSVSVGYWNNEERNKKVFGHQVIDGREYRYYKTGDEGYLVDGMLHYCGRIDLQVKLHGYRIELEDIESHLLELQGITQAVVIPKYKDGKVNSLVAAVVSNTSVENEREEGKEIKERLKESLPEYMIPKKIKFLLELPRTNNGKIDRKKVGELV